MNKVSLINTTVKLYSPAFVYDESFILQSFQALGSLHKKLGFKILFPLKSFSITDGLRFMAPLVDGFSVSSLFEARLARDVLGNQKSVHITTPGFKPEEIPVISELCDYISFNSLSQWERYRSKVSSITSCGLRINPELAFIKDDRYNPCRNGSKLGVPLYKLSEISNDGYKPLHEVKGLHFHTNCESTDFDQLFSNCSAHRCLFAGSSWTGELGKSGRGGIYLKRDKILTN